jgi:hypothetical protein
MFDVHAIVTRFAVPAEFKPRGGRDESENPTHHLDKDWLWQRVSLLDRWCAPTVNRQTNKNFIWVLAVDERVPRHIQTSIVMAAGDNAVLAVVHEGEKFTSAFTRLFEARGENKILSSRLDSDDGISKHFVNTVQKNIEVGKALNFTHGLRYDPGLRLVEHRYDKTNPYMSYLSHDALHAYDLGSHGRWHERGVEVVDYDTKTPMWLQVIHGNNAKNQMRGGLPSTERTDTILENNFGVMGV